MYRLVGCSMIEPRTRLFNFTSYLRYVVCVCGVCVQMSNCCPCLANGWGPGGTSGAHTFILGHHSATCGVLALPQVDLLALTCSAWVVPRHPSAGSLTAWRQLETLLFFVLLCMCLCPVYMHTCYVCMCVCVVYTFWVFSDLLCMLSSPQPMEIM